MVEKEGDHVFDISRIQPDSKGRMRWNVTTAYGRRMRHVATITHAGLATEPYQVEVLVQGADTLEDAIQFAKAMGKAHMAIQHDDGEGW